MDRVIDFHLHVGTKDHWNPWVMEYFAQVNPHYTANFSERITPQDVTRYLESQQVEAAVVLSEYAPKATGVVTNEFTRDFCAGHDMLIPFGAPCLYDDMSLAEQAERAVVDLGMKGFKMLPTYSHFYPNDERLFEFYEVARDYGLPLQFHTGISLFKGSRVKYGDPLFLDDVADQFDDLQIVLDHGGRNLWYDRAEWMISRHKNVYIGITGVPAKHVTSAFPNLERFPDRFIFGSDWPGLSDIAPFVERIRRLPFSGEIIDMILFQNAARLLGIS